MDDNELLIYFSCFIYLLVSHLKLDISEPGLFIWLPLHPALEDLTATRNVAYKQDGNDMSSIIIFGVIHHPNL